jgi:hypothetical protein
MSILFLQAVVRLNESRSEQKRGTEEGKERDRAIGWKANLMSFATFLTLAAASLVLLRRVHPARNKNDSNWLREQSRLDPFASLGTGSGREKWF